MLWLHNQKTTWPLKAESPVYHASTIQSCSQTISFCWTVWALNSQDTLLSIATTNKHQCRSSWCRPAPSPCSATTPQPGSACFRDSGCLNWLILTQKSSNESPRGRPKCCPDRIWPAFFLSPVLDGTCEHATSMGIFFQEIHGGSHGK